MRVKICIPAYKDIGKLQALIDELNKQTEHDFSKKTIFFSVFVDVSRNESICNSDLCWPKLPNVDVILCIDTDMDPSVGNILDLLTYMYDPDINVICANYRKTGTDNEYTASIDGVNFETDIKNLGLKKVKLSAFGLSAFKINVFRQIPKPWFESGYIKYKGENNEEKFRHVPEDINFCRKLHKHGFDIYCDFDIMVTHNNRDDNFLDSTITL